MIQDFRFTWLYQRRKLVKCTTNKRKRVSVVRWGNNTDKKTNDHMDNDANTIIIVFSL